jgi:hypothetical protein
VTEVKKYANFPWHISISSSLEIVLLVKLPFGNRIEVTFRQINELDVQNRRM